MSNALRKTDLYRFFTDEYRYTDKNAKLKIIKLKIILKFIIYNLKFFIC